MEKVEVKEAGEKGKGLFAVVDIKKGEEILYFEGEVVEVGEGEEENYSAEIRDHWHPIDEKDGKKVYVLPQAPWKFMNHSCEANAGIKNDRHLVAIRDIKAGEEINIDYSMLFLEGWHMECKCGSKNCRGEIVTFDKLDEEDQERLKDYVSSYVLKKYLK